MTNSIAKNSSVTNELQLTAEAEKRLGLLDSTPDSPFTFNDYHQNLSATPTDVVEMKQQFELLLACADEGIVTDTSAIRFLHRLTGENSFGKKLWWATLESDAKTFAHEFIPAMTGWISEGYEFADKNTSFMQDGTPKGLAMGLLMGGRLVYTMASDFLHGIKATFELQNTATMTGDPETNAHAFFMSSLLLSQLLIMRGMAKSFPKKPPLQKSFATTTPAFATSGHASAIAVTRASRITRFGPSPKSIAGVMLIKGSNGTGDSPRTLESSASHPRKRIFDAPKLSRRGDKPGLFAHRGRKSYPAKKTGDHLEVRIGKAIYYYDLKGNRLGSNKHAHVVKKNGKIQTVIIEGTKQKFRLTDNGMIAISHDGKMYFFDKAGMRHPSTYNNFVLTHFEGIPAIFHRGRPVDYKLSGMNVFELSVGERKLFMDLEGRINPSEVWTNSPDPIH